MTLGCCMEDVMTQLLERSFPRMNMGASTLMLVLSVGCGTNTDTGDESPAADVDDDGVEGCLSPGDHDLQVIVAGFEQPFRVHIPPALEGLAPVVVQLHGAGGTGEEMDRITGLSSLADDEGFMVITPEGAGEAFQTWNAGIAFGDTDHVDTLGAAIDRTLTLITCDGGAMGDPRRVYVAGQSNGAMMAYRLACSRSDLVRAIVSGAGYTGNTDETGAEIFPCDLERPVPILQMNGGQDRCVPIEGRGNAIPPAEENVSAWRERNGCETGGTDTTDALGVRRRRWSCDGNAAVEWITEDAHGHAWAGSNPSVGLSATTCGAPSESFSATEELWRFFQAH